MSVYDDRLCLLGEGPLWHPEREQLFWFDILGKKLLTRVKSKIKDWVFDEHVSTAGWVDRDHLIVASESALFSFHLETGKRRDLCALEADLVGTRSNDGRADPYGGFWIGTMGKAAEAGQARIYRYYRGELRQLYGDLTISNAICFSPDGRYAHFADTAKCQIYRVMLDETGWPCTEHEPFLDFSTQKLNPDGAVVDKHGNLWVALWGTSCIAAFRPDGSLLQSVEVPASQVSCPSFGGADYSTLFATSARTGLSDSALATEPNAGAVFAFETEFQGLPEYKVIL